MDCYDGGTLSLKLQPIKHVPNTRTNFAVAMRTWTYKVVIAEVIAGDWPQVLSVHPLWNLSHCLLCLLV